MTRVRTGVARTFASLSVRNYRLFFLGQLVSLTGTWMQLVAQDWLVVQLGGRGLALGFVGGLQFLPMLLFGMWGGLIADRLDKRKVLVVTQTLAGLLALVLAVLTVTGAVQLWHVFVLAFLLGCVTVADNPTRQAFVTEMVGPDHVANAVGLNSAVFNAARLVGPAVAVLLIKTVGISAAFFLNAGSYVAVIVGLVAMDPARLQHTNRAERSPGQVREGLRYVRQSPVLFSTLLLVTVVATFGLNFKVFLPLLALSLHGGAGIYGLFTSLLAGGALAGSLATAARGRPTAPLLVGTGIAFGALTLATATAPGVAWASLLLIPTGAMSMAFIATANSTLQLASSPAMRGRVMALYAFVFLGSTPLGGPLMGWISQHWGPRDAMALGGLLSLAASLAAWAHLARTTEANENLGFSRRTLARVSWFWQ